MRLFGGAAQQSGVSKNRVPRHSSGWQALRKFLREQESLRVLDVGATSSTNINLLTSLGHSIYMADLVGEASSEAWTSTAEDGTPVFDAASFLDSNLPREDRAFDVVLLWDCADYLPAAAVPPLFERLHAMTSSGGRILVFGHLKPETGYVRYHLREDDQVDVQRLNELPVRSVFSNRQLETLLQGFSNYRFFLAKDNLREVLVNR